MVREVADVYTRTIFDIFQEEFVKSNSCSLNKIEDGTISKYRVVNGEDDSKIFTVTFHDSEKRVSCSCCKFEFSGVLCRHVLKVFSEVGIQTLPKEYILKRWTMSAKSSRQKAVALCCNDLCRDVIKYAEEGATSAVMYKIAKEALQKAFAEVIAAKKDVRLVEPSKHITIKVLVLIHWFVIS
ncbi:Protein FAR1-RELATED SEQUENCE 3 [Acorus gramineus]|uniref:Protein FAR1-RELATED SEQUENCE n=1 Tax=Acorus gramineus TaxID=55184 RepID=A0AAV9BKC8_ACOGR|nr:Protein FAR1-RELATED SEQUENCE 3 [Acorus gramineus]